jgi:hypothetical protein
MPKACRIRATSPPIFAEVDADVARTSIVAKAKRSKAADRKAITKETDDGLPVHSFRSLSGDLATITYNTMAMAASIERSPNSRSVVETRSLLPVRVAHLVRRSRTIFFRTFCRLRDVGVGDHLPGRFVEQLRMEV